MKWRIRERRKHRCRRPISLFDDAGGMSPSPSLSLSPPAVLLPTIALSMLALSSRASPSSTSAGHPYPYPRRGGAFASVFRLRSLSPAPSPRLRSSSSTLYGGRIASVVGLVDPSSSSSLGFFYSPPSSPSRGRTGAGGPSLPATVEERVDVGLGETRILNAEADTQSSVLAASESKVAVVEDFEPQTPRADERRRRGSSDDDDTRRTIASLVSKYKTMREVESAIVRSGRQGRTDDALSLYRAVWVLDAERRRIRRKGQKNSGAAATTTGDGVGGSTARLVAKSPLRPTTRLANVAIDACARASPVRQSEAFDLFDFATSNAGGLSPNVFTFGSLLAACARSGDANSALDLLADLEADRYLDVRPNGVIYSTAISACERADPPRPDTALALLNNATFAGAEVGVVGFNAAISAMARGGKWQTAVRLLNEMIVRSGASSPSPLLSPSDSSSSPPSSSSAVTVALLGDDIYPGVDVADLPPLLKVPADTDGAASVPKPDDVTYGTAMAACERSGQWEEVLRIARAAMSHPEVVLDGMALTSAVKACQQLGLADEAVAYLELMKGLGGDDRRTRGRMRKGARQALRGPDGVAYSLAISACARASGGSRWRDGVRLLNEMRENAAKARAAGGGDDGVFIPTKGPGVVAYTAAVAGCSEAGEYLEALRLIRDMRAEGVQPNVVTFSAVINACASASANLARRREEEGGADMNEVRAPMLKALRLLEAMNAPGSTVQPNIFVYNAAIRACAEGMNLDKAFDLLVDLKEGELEPTIVTYGSLMTACERVGNVEAASRVFRMVKEDENVESNEIIYGAAISCCKKAGQPERALLLLRKMISENLAPNTATFNTVIAAISEGGTASSPDLWEKALAVYRVMKSKHAPPGVAPNRQTYNALISALASKLQPAYAESFLNAMRADGYVPDVDLYTLTVRSYERCGNPMKALRLMESMREVGYDFYDIEVLNQAFKNAVKLVNKVGKGFSSDDEDSVRTTKDGTIYFDGDYVKDQVLQSFK